MASVWFDGVDEINRLAVDVGRTGFRATQMAPKVVQRTAANIERDGKMFCPVDTGNLMNSISHSMTGPFSAEIGPSAGYGSYVEHGTSRMAPAAYMGPALDRNTPSFLEAAAQLAEDAVGLG